MNLYTYEELKAFVDHCRRCPLSQTRNHSVMGRGNLHSPIRKILENPIHIEFHFIFMYNPVIGRNTFPVNFKS